MEITIDFNNIKNWDTFHSAFKKGMGFPDFYGANMDAWIDCMSYIDDPSSGMSEITVSSNENLNIITVGIENLSKNYPEILKAFIECTAFVNQRFLQSNSLTRVQVVAI